MENKPSETLSDIRRLMERSSRFSLLSGYSLIAAGICGLAGVWQAHREVMQWRMHPGGEHLADRLILTGSLTLVAALALGYAFTWGKVRRQQVPLWDAVVRKVSIHFAIPLFTGGVFVVGMIYWGQYQFIATACLVFYGLALVNASHFTVRPIRMLGLMQLLLGFICLFTGYNLICLMLGFGIMNILAGWLIQVKKP
jgi:hypothetical protein